MANPRKFSEKIALHNQKQAEETAAFEAIMRDVAATTRVGVPKQPNVPPQAQPTQQLMHLQQPQLGVYRGGSLPNVNQTAIDLQGALEDMKHMSGRESLIDRYHRQRQMQSPHRRPFPFDKRTDCSPYGAAYLSPPPDTSWRRTSSDSALHTSSMGQQNMPPNSRRENSVPQENLNMYELQQVQARPKSCEVPGINIYPSPEQGQSIPISNNTGSLPDLSNIHFPSPLATPLDAPGTDESHQYVNHHGNHGNLSPTAPHHHISVMRQAQNASPSSRRRAQQGGGGPLPLVIQGSPTQIRHSMSPQGTVHDMSANRFDSRLHGQQYHPYGSPHRLSPSPAHSPHRQSSSSSNNTLTVPSALPLPLQNYIINQSPANSQPPNHLLTSMDLLSMNSDTILGTHPSSEQHLSHLEASIGHNGPVSPQHSLNINSNQIKPKIVISSEMSSNTPLMDINCQNRDSNLASSSQMCSKDPAKSQGSPLTYRNSQSECPASPNSPCSPHSFSPAQSPGLPPNSNVSGSPCSAFADNYYMHQQAQTNSLQHQFEQFNMDNPDMNTSVTMYQNMINPQQHYNHVNNTLSGTPNYMSHTQQQQNHFYKQSNSNQHNPVATQHQQQHPPSSPHQSPHQPGSPQMPASPQSPHTNTHGMTSSPTQLTPQEHMYNNLSPQMSPQNQPNNIPDIILTGELDHLICGADDTARQDFVKELGNAMASMHDVFGDSELLSSDEALKDGLEPLDFNQLQMLTDSSIVTDPATEDSFRLDRL